MFDIKILKLIHILKGDYRAIFDNIPELTYEKIGSDYVGSAVDVNGNIVASHWLKKRRYGDAFGGRKITLKMKNGSTETIKDYWFDNGCYPDHGDFMSIGAETLKGLQNCFVFFSYNINTKTFKNMVSEYLSHDRTYGYDEIKDWCNLQHKWHDVVVHGKKIPFMMNKYGDMAERESKKRVYPRYNIVKTVNGTFREYVYFKFNYRDSDRLIKLESNYLEVLKATLPQTEDEIRKNCNLPSIEEEKQKEMDMKLDKMLTSMTREERLRMKEKLSKYSG